ncbi:NUDIX domain-containing protein [Paenibacillus enshidis]|uniref:NUDIX domain-containing protein n=1 Tax=Paenibacillus enshidis TaxID=1458439 RepID=A0ABV5AWS6_9BACL
MERFSLHCGVNLLLFHKQDILLLLRNNTGFADGMFGVVGGHLDGGESATSALIRETQEEINIQVQPQDLKLVVTVHRMLDHCEYIDLFFKTDTWEGELRNNELHKHLHYAWFPAYDLPKNTMPLVYHVLGNYLSGMNYLEFGWDNER